MSDALPEPVRPATTGMPGRTPAQIRRDIDAQRKDLGRSVEQLRGRVAELTDWRRQVREHRSQRIAGAAVVGFAVGGLMMLRRRR
jgi:50S ribosomal subunit-associated GTPase HflX